MPRKAKGAIELDVRLEPVVSAERQAPPGWKAADAPAYTRTGIILIGSVLLRRSS